MVVEGLYIARWSGGPMVGLREARALAGRGIEGDRHAGGGFFHPAARPVEACDLTIIAAEAVEGFNRATGRSLAPGDLRRNLVVRGRADLAPLAGRALACGEVRLRVIEDCPPCRHLAEMLGHAVLRGFARRGGLRTRIVTGGTLRVGARIEVGT